MLELLLSLKLHLAKKYLGTSVTTSTFILKNSAGASITGQVTSDGLTATFTPSSQLAFSKSYTATVKGGSTGVKDLAGNFMTQDYSWSFTTAADASQTTTSCGSNLAVSVTSSGSQNSFPPTNAIDNNLNTKWYSTFIVNPWIKANFGALKSVCGVDIAWADGATRQYSFIIAVSTDGTIFTNVFSGMSKGTTTTPERYTFPETQAQYVRITMTQSHSGSASSLAQISELDIYGQATSASGQFSSSSTSPLATTKETMSTALKNNTMTPRASESDSQIRLPVAKHDKYSTEVNKPILAAILENDQDPDGNGLNLLSVSPTMEGGHVTINKNGTVTFTPLQGFVGKDSFSYMILDGKGKTDQARVDVIIKGTFITPLRPVTQPPIDEGTSNMDSGQERTQAPTDQKKQTTDAFKVGNNKLPHSPKSNLVVSNTPPKANAGENKIVKEGLRVTLDGSKSQDRDAKIVSYIWRQLSGPPVHLEHVKEIRSDFVAPAVKQDVSLVFRLTLTDENGNSNSDITGVKILNSPTSPNSNDRESLFANPYSQNSSLLGH